MDTNSSLAVFVADDSLSMRERIVGMVNKISGAIVVGEACALGNTATGIFDTQPDVVLLDIHLVGGNSLNVLRKAHAQSPDMVFIVLTNYPNPQYRKAYMDAGASYFLDKSTDIDSAAAIIKNLAVATQH